MYCLSDEQIDYIANDISARGIAMVSLQHDLVDHICCMLEQHLQEDGDFESAYRDTVRQLYRHDMREIETETVQLLTFKHYYLMKKILLFSGSAASAFLALGLVFKFMHWPGASALIVLGVGLLSLVFLPLMFTLKVRERQPARDRVVAGVGTLAAIAVSLGVLFKIMHWPGANMLCIAALAVMLALFLPVYFFSGIRNADTKVNTIVSSVLIFAGCALLLVLVRRPEASRQQYVRDTAQYIRSEKMLRNDLAQAGTLDAQSGSIQSQCEALKTFLVKQDTGVERLGDDFEQRGTWLGSGDAGMYINGSEQARQQLQTLQRSIVDYNAQHLGLEPLPTNVDLFTGSTDVKSALDDLVQFQMLVLHNHRRMASIASK